MTLSETEISSLRDELVTYSEHILDLVKFAVTAASALIGFGLSAGKPTGGYIVLLALLILIPSLHMEMNRRRNIQRIATYLRAFGGREFRYETRLRELRRKPGSNQLSFQIGALQGFVVTGFVSILVSFYYLFDQGLLVIVPSVALGLWTVFSIFQLANSRSLQMGGQFDDALVDAWNKIKAQEQVDEPES